MANIDAAAHEEVVNAVLAMYPGETDLATKCAAKLAFTDSEVRGLSDYLIAKGEFERLLDEAKDAKGFLWAILLFVESAHEAACDHDDVPDNEPEELLGPRYMMS